MEYYIDREATRKMNRKLVITIAIVLLAAFCLCACGEVEVTST